MLRQGRKGEGLAEGELREIEVRRERWVGWRRLGKMHVGGRKVVRESRIVREKERQLALCVTDLSWRYSFYCPISFRIV